VSSSGYHLDSGVAARFVGDDNEPISIPLTRAGIAPSVAYFLYESSDCSGPASAEVDDSSIVRPAFYDYLPTPPLCVTHRVALYRVSLERDTDPSALGCVLDPE